MLSVIQSSQISVRWNPEILSVILYIWKKKEKKKTEGFEDTVQTTSVGDSRSMLSTPPPPPPPSTSSVLLFFFIFSSVTLSLVFRRSPWAVRSKSGEQMRNKWVLSGTHEGGRYAYHCLRGGLHPLPLCCPEPQLPPSHCPPLYLLFYLRNAGPPEERGMRNKESELGVPRRWQVPSPDRHPLLSPGGLAPRWGRTPTTQFTRHHHSPTPPPPPVLFLRLKTSQRSIFWSVQLRLIAAVTHSHTKHTRNKTPCPGIVVIFSSMESEAGTSRINYRSVSKFSARCGNTNWSGTKRGK